MSVQVRPFRRDDRDQLTDLVNAHVGAVVPGVSVSTSRILSQLEREPGEYVVDPWVRERVTLVAEQRGRISAAVHVLRYDDGEAVGPAYRDTGEIRWLVCWPGAPFWPDSMDAGTQVLAAAVRYLRASRARRVSADGALPAPGVYGIPAQWPHIEQLLLQGGFTKGDRVELVFLADVPRLHRPAPPLTGLRVDRSLGGLGTCLNALLGDRRIGYIEVCGRSTDVARVALDAGWADVGNLWVEPDHRRRGVGAWLLGQAADWLQLGSVDRLLDYCSPDDDGYLQFLRRTGFTELTRTTRDWPLAEVGPGRATSAVRADG